MRASLLTLITIFAVLVISSPTTSHAEDWPTLETYVGQVTLIVKAKTHVMPDGKLTFRVTESWKGTYDPADFLATTKDGRFFASPGEHGVNVVDGQEIVFFFGPHNQPAPGKYARHSTSFPIKEGKLVYASTNDFMQKTYTVAEFERAIKATRP